VIYSDKEITFRGFFTDIFKLRYIDNVMNKMYKMCFHFSCFAIINAVKGINVFNWIDITSIFNERNGIIQLIQNMINLNLLTCIDNL
jgi:hypothetical protein